jgi:hypothetical protein
LKLKARWPQTLAQQFQALQVVAGPETLKISRLQKLASAWIPGLAKILLAFRPVRVHATGHSDLLPHFQSMVNLHLNRVQ